MYCAIVLYTCGPNSPGLPGRPARPMSPLSPCSPRVPFAPGRPATPLCPASPGIPDVQILNVGKSPIQIFEKTIFIAHCFQFATFYILCIHF